MGSSESAKQMWFKQSMPISSTSQNADAFQGAEGLRFGAVVGSAVK